MSFQIIREIKDLRERIAVLEARLDALISPRASFSKVIANVVDESVAETIAEVVAEVGAKKRGRPKKVDAGIRA